MYHLRTTIGVRYVLVTFTLEVVHIYGSTATEHKKEGKFSGERLLKKIFKFEDGKVIHTLHEKKRKNLVNDKFSCDRKGE